MNKRSYAGVLIVLSFVRVICLLSEIDVTISRSRVPFSCTSSRLRCSACWKRRSLRIRCSELSPLVRTRSIASTTAFLVKCAISFASLSAFLFRLTTRYITDAGTQSVGKQTVRLQIGLGLSPSTCIVTTS